MKPQAIAPQYGSLPAELRQMPIWLIWRYELDDKGRWAKRPYVADQGAGRAKTNDPSTWRSFEHALKFAPRASGLGLCFTATQYCGIDLDCCRNPETGAIASWAQRVIDRLNTYTEISPSGTGLHTIVALTRPLPEDGAHKHGGKDQNWEIGIYDRTSPRYFCATGVIVDGHNNIRTCDPDEFYPQFLAGEFDAEPAKPPKSNGHAANANGNNTGPYLVDDRRARLQSGLWEGLYPSQSEGDLAFCSYVAAEYGNDPVLIDQAFRKSGLMRDKWDRRTSGGRTYGQITIDRVIARRRKDSPALWAEADLQREFTVNNPDLRYVDEWKCWMHYGDGVWHKDRIRIAFDRALSVCLNACRTIDIKDTATLKRLKSAQTRAAIENMARSDQQHIAISDQWDSDLRLLNTSGGTCQLQGGSMREHRTTDYMTKRTGVTPLIADCPLWLQFLDRITAGDVELQRYLQRMAGYCLTGITSEHVLFFLYGTGANGKTTFTNTLLGIWRDYAQVAQMETFTENNNDRHPTELAALRGARLVVASETEVGKRWAESRIKALTGGEPVRAHFMRCDDFEFIPQFKLMIQGNHKPGLRAVDEAIRRRVHLVPFMVTIPPEERDPKLTEKLREEWPQILQWAINGCLAWQQQGLNPPAAVRDATEEYFMAEDAIRTWLNERAIVSPQAGSTKASALYQDFKTWAESAGEFCGSLKRFGQELRDRGFRSYPSNGICFEGIKLRDSEPSEAFPI